MFSQSCFFAFIIQNSQKKVHSTFLSENINLIIAYVDILLIIGNLTFLLLEILEKKDKRTINFADIRTLKYPTLIIISYLSIAIFSSLINSFKYSAFIIAVLSIIPLISLMYFRPYTENKLLNTFGAVTTQCLPILTSSIYLLLYINKL